MIKFVRKFIILLVIVFPLGYSYGDFDDIGVGARPIGMSNAFTALADDVSAIYYNPAGLAFIKRAEFSAEYGRLYMGLDDDSNLSRSFLGYVHPIHIAKDKKRFWKKKIIDPDNLPYIDYGTIGCGLASFSLVGDYEERALYVSYGRRLRNDWSAGVNIKNLYEKYTIDDYLRQDPVFEYGSLDSLQTISVDIGTIYKIGPMFSAGLSVWDINQPDVGLKSTNRLNRQYRWGCAYCMRNFTALLDLVQKKDDQTIHAGAEKWLFKRRIGVRAGYTQGSRDVRNYTMGSSINMFDMQLDYAFQFPLAGIKQVSGSHRVTFTFRFGYGIRTEQINDNLEEAFIKIQREHQELRQEYSDLEMKKNKLEEKYLEEAQRQKLELEKIKQQEEILKQQLRDRPVRTIKPVKIEKKPLPETYTVQEGETLQSIAEKLYDDPLKWNLLYQANKHSIRRSKVETGQILQVPKP
ncbi:MAG: LysM peptidoglycan-binding domain-containing protein [bacterium]